MKNIQVIDAAVNCTYDIFHAQDDQFDLIFPNGTDVEFIEDFIERIGEDAADTVLNAIMEMSSRQEGCSRAVGKGGHFFTL